MEHTTRDDQPKLLTQCSLPLTGARVVNRVITNFGVFDIDECKLTLLEIAPGVSLDEIRRNTQPELQLATSISN
jgi:acyl CoA:acetate/3-ketoacid CoA transferase beta subunit